MCHQQSLQWVLTGESFGRGVVLIGMPVVVVLVLLTVFQGLNASFACTVVSGVTFTVFEMVVLFATTVTVNSSLLSLLDVFCFPVEMADMVGKGFVLCELEIWLLVVLVAVSAAAVVLLLGSLSCVGAIIGLKKLVIDDFLLVFCLSYCVVGLG